MQDLNPQSEIELTRVSLSSFRLSRSTLMLFIWLWNESSGVLAVSALARLDLYISRAEETLKEAASRAIWLAKTPGSDLHRLLGNIRKQNKPETYLPRWQTFFWSRRIYRLRATSISLAEKASSRCHLYSMTNPGFRADLLENDNWRIEHIRSKMSAKGYKGCCLYIMAQGAFNILWLISELQNELPNMYTIIYSQNHYTREK